MRKLKYLFIKAGEESQMFRHSFVNLKKKNVV